MSTVETGRGEIALRLVFFRQRFLKGTRAPRGFPGFTLGAIVKDKIAFLAVYFIPSMYNGPRAGLTINFWLLFIFYIKSKYEQVYTSLKKIDRQLV
jgi:hypothetical protein